MKHTSRDFVKAILLNEEFDGRNTIRQTVLPLFERSNAPIVEKLSTMILIAKNHRKSTLEECLKEMNSKFSTVLTIIEEHGVRLPEEEVELSKMVKAIYEEGEGGGEGAAPTNVSAGIDSSTPRIKRKQSVEGDECLDTKVT
jgi:hypothetical protein